MFAKVRRPRAASVTLATAVLIGSGAVWYALPSRGVEAHPVVVRVNQAGYLTGGPKEAFAMGSDDDAVASAGFQVVDESGRPVLSGRTGPRTGAWNTEYDTVRTLDLTALTTPGTYRLKLTGTATGTSPRFKVAPAGELMRGLAAENVRFFQAQRDGADVVPGVLDRKPSHLADRAATVYATPRYDDEGTELTEPLRRVAGPVDVSGGWFDAGDFLKFTHTASYSTAQLLLAQRSFGDVPGLDAEARHGLAWLDRMWDGRTGTLYAQVGIGAGSKEFRSDHDVWRLPEADDALDVRQGDPDYTIKHRPVFRANEPGEPISPNLAGRVAGAFALAAQADAEDNPERARQWLEKAAAVYGQADTEHSGELVTAFPHGFYPEESWQDDMEFGAAELALAARQLGDERAGRWQREAGEWMRKYLASDARGTLGVADVSALAHADLLRLAPSGAAVADLRRQLSDGERRADKDPFRAGAVYTDFDAVPHTFGLVATARLYARATGDHRYDAFAERQRGWALGANAWGTGFMVGAGETSPHCPEHQAANLTGAPLRGAVVNGPNAAAKLSELNSFDTMRPCAYGTDTWKRFDGKGARYLDHVGAWQTVEPADDFTSTALLAFALTAG
ncbi:glycoside hydrolase family 9 protein [Streptomyces sp. BPTC-684]|uniref:glycoside hydrolase family 9 protein n=1 Tax=Streptomyces sp. BPTC-684 TaxID=3043734 RepID=UPI0024B0BF58|nr:glycoside hydrolase family 9 protein [Streptomyces sp. BPTC-684]WHM40728.1 glycoside hydrolase family 9 protein [Streptomyces sp. BPTC-684]